MGDQLLPKRGPNKNQRLVIMIDVFYHVKYFELNNLPMMSEKYEITLIMKCYTSSPMELRVIRKQSRELSTDRVPKPCVEIVQNQLRSMSGYTTMILK